MMKLQTTTRQIQCDAAAKPRSPSVIRHCLLFCLLMPVFAFAQDKVVTPAPAPGTEHADDAPFAFPPLDHYTKLWENSMFTTKSLPPPDDAPKGPIFTDNLTLAGIYEVDGAVVGVILDKTTSLVTEVRIGAENENGVKIVRVTPGPSADKTRIQLQKGEEAGWVTFANEAAPPPDQTAQGLPGGPGDVQNGSAIPNRPMNPQPNMQPPQNQPGPGRRGIPGPPPSMRNQPPAPAAVEIPQSPAVPQTLPPTPAAGDGDIPLPPQ